MERNGAMDYGMVPRGASSSDAGRWISPSQHMVATEGPFADRLGGIQGFTIDADDMNGRAILEEQPDAAPLLSLREALDLAGFRSWNNWRAAILEGWGWSFRHSRGFNNELSDWRLLLATCLLVFLLGAGASGVVAQDLSPLKVTYYATLLNTFAISLFIFAAAPTSGGHLNPTITLATFFSGPSSLPRSILYLVAQCVGTIVGGYWLNLGLGDAYFATVSIWDRFWSPVAYDEFLVLMSLLAHDTIPGCTVNTAEVSAGQMFVIEYMFSQGLIFMAFGVGLDPRQGKVFGPALSPILVGRTLGLATFASIMMLPGYTGIFFNPARCLGLMTPTGNMERRYIHWVASSAAAVLNGVFYQFAPPYDKIRLQRQRNRILGKDV